MEIYQTHRGLNKRRFKIKDIARKSANQEKFTDDKGKEWTVAAYFQKNYFKLKYPDLPLVQVGAAKKMYLPMEICHVSGKQRVVKLLADYQIQEMIKKTSASPQEHLSDIRKYILENKYEEKVNFGMKINPNIEVVKGRIINAPELQYLNCKNGRPIMERPRDGSWNMRDKMMINGGTLETWSILSLVDPKRFGLDKLQWFASELVRVLQASGLKVPTTQPPLLYWDGKTTIADAVQSAADAAFQNTKKRPQLVVCVKTTSDAAEYAEIKRASDCNLGVPSQCVLLKHVEYDPKPQYLANVGLKINQKLGGRNTVLNAMPTAW